MRLSRVVFLTFIALFTMQLAAAQAQPSMWTPQGIEALRHSASSKTEFTLDHSMLVFASKLDPDNEDLRRVIAGVSGISVQSFHFAKPWMYDSAALDEVREEYRAAGWNHWKQLVNNREKSGGPGVNDFWVRFENNAISNIAMLFAERMK